MKKSDLKNGAVVEVRNGNIYLKIDNTLLDLKDFGCYQDLNSYDDNLYYCDIEKGFTIIKVNNNVDNGEGFINYALWEVFQKDKWAWIRNKNPKLTADEKAILRSVGNKYKYIARDEDNDLYIYKMTPRKSTTDWSDGGGYSGFYIFNHLFQFIKWEDEEPYSIAELLKCEVEENE